MFQGLLQYPQTLLNLYVIRRRCIFLNFYADDTRLSHANHFCCSRKPLKGLARIKHINCRCSETKTSTNVKSCRPSHWTGNPQYGFLFYFNACLYILQVVSLLSFVFVCSPWINFLCLCVTCAFYRFICKALLNAVSFTRGTVTGAVLAVGLHQPYGAVFKRLYCGYAYPDSVQGWSHTSSSPHCSHSESFQTGCPELLWHSAFHRPSESLSCRHSTAPSPPTSKKKTSYQG